MRTPLGRVIAYFILLAGLASWSGCGTRQAAAPEARPASEPGVAAVGLAGLFGVDRREADVAMAVDVSGSMKEHYAALRGAVVSFASSLAERDRLELRVFNSSVSQPVVGSGAGTSAKVGAFLDSVVPAGQTDLGLAISKALESMETSDGGRAQAFLLITDGRHQPPATSPYSRDFTGDPDWQELRERAAALCARNTVVAFGFGFGQQTDITVLQSVFPSKNVEVFVGSPREFAETLGHIRELLQVRQLRTRVEREIENGYVEVGFTPQAIVGSEDGFESTLAIRNRYEFLPIRVVDVGLGREASAAPEVDCELVNAQTDVLLAPGETWEGRVRGTVSGDLPTLVLGRREQILSAGFVPVVTVKAEHNDELVRILGVAPNLRLEMAGFTVEMRRGYGLSLVLLGAIALGVALASAAAMRSRLRRRRQAELERLALGAALARARIVKGNLKHWRAGAEEDWDDGVDLEMYRSARVVIQSDGTGGIEVVPAEEADDDLALAMISGEPQEAPVAERFFVRSAASHDLWFEVEGAMRRARTGLRLFHQDVFRIDDTWLFRYTNEGFGPRSESDFDNGETPQPER